MYMEVKNLDYIIIGSALGIGNCARYVHRYLNSCRIPVGLKYSLYVGYQCAPRLITPLETNKIKKDTRQNFIWFARKLWKKEKPERKLNRSKDLKLLRKFGT